MSNRKYVALCLGMLILSFGIRYYLTRTPTSTLSPASPEVLPNATIENETRSPAAHSDAVYQFPRADNSVWRARDYHIVEPAHPGRIMIEQGKTRLIASYPQIVFFRCGEKGNGICLRFPNGQTVELNDELKNTIPTNYLYPRTRDFMRAHPDIPVQTRGQR